MLLRMSQDAQTHRVAFQLRVKPDRLDEYLQRHTAVWPEFLAEMEAAGVRNYSIFSRGDGVLFGYYECDDPAASQAQLTATDVDARWQAEMEEFFDRSQSGADGFTDLVEVFNLDDQLGRARAAGFAG